MLGYSTPAFLTAHSTDNEKRRDAFVDSISMQSESFSFGSKELREEKLLLKNKEKRKNFKFNKKKKSGRLDPEKGKVIFTRFSLFNGIASKSEFLCHQVNKQT